jgi:hypothetical protein
LRDGVASLPEKKKKRLDLGLLWVDGPDTMKTTGVRERRSWFAPVMLLGYAVIGLIAYLWIRKY